MAKDPTDFWQSFGDSSAFIEVECDNSGRSLAVDALQYYGISCNDTLGGDLPNLDIKHMDVMQVVAMSLLEQSAKDNKIYEAMVTEDGDVEFNAVGRYVGLSGGDVYYEIQTGTYKETAKGVMVTGQKPLPVRKPIEWKPIWGDDPKEIYDTGMMYNPNCFVKDFNQYCTIVFNDPHLDSAYEDGIENLYEIGRDNPFDSIMGYARYLNFDNWKDSPDTTITRTSTAKIMLPLNLDDVPDFGTLTKRPAFVEDIVNAACYEGQGTDADFKNGVKLNLPEKFRYTNVRNTKVDRFLGILDVFVIGIELDSIQAQPVSKYAATKANPTKEDAKIFVAINDSAPKIFKLDRGTNYNVAYDKTDDLSKKTPYIVFADNSRQWVPTQFEKGAKYYIDPTCDYANATGVTEGNGTILPTGENVGILAQKIWVSVELETPSIVVYDPDGWNNKAKAIADKLDYQLGAMWVTEEPAPIAFNGQLIDQTQSIKDHDPTTAQNFEDTAFEQALDIMDGGGGMSLTLSFLDEDGVKRLSSALYDYLNSGDGVEATYVCGPGTDVKLGGTAPNGGIVNSISYSYQDSNSYTISVNAGSKLVGNFAQVSGGPSYKQAENDNSAKGTVIEDMGNHIFFKVRIDGFGERIAVNMAPSIIRVGDKVQCSINNNPVEA